MEIEFRNPDSIPFVSDFDGILIIDEIELHLHPEWQAKMYLILKSILPKAQVITTTHSPHVIQVAEANEVIPLRFDEQQKVVRTPIDCSEYGFKGWTVEEILKDVMGMNDTRSEGYVDTSSELETALLNEDYVCARKAFYKLDKMLHPTNPLRKILKIQLAGFLDD